MSERIPPPSWTEWTRNPSERSTARKVFDDFQDDLRRAGLVEVRSSILVQLARYSFLQTKNARIDVGAFVKSVPDALFVQVSPAYRQNEVEAVLKILVEAGLAAVETETPAGLQTVVLTERRTAGEVARIQEVQSAVSYLNDVYARWNPADLVSRNSSFPTPVSVAKGSGVDRTLLAAGEGCTALDDRPEANDVNPNPFHQDTVSRGGQPLLLLRFWPLPDPKGSGAGTDPELQIVAAAERPLASLVRDLAVPVLAAFFGSRDHHEAAAEVQVKYASYMRKYREKFTSVGPLTGDKISQAIASSDPESEAFASAVYVAVQVLKTLVKAPSPPARPLAVVYQAARIAYAYTMALRVQKRKTDQDAAARSQDAARLVARLKNSPRPLSVEELKRTPDSSKSKDMGAKYPTITDLLPLGVPQDGSRPPVFELMGSYVHRESLVRTFLELREKEIHIQRDRLAQLWAKEGIPAVEEFFLAEEDVSPDFLKTLEMVREERVLAFDLSLFLKDFLPSDGDLFFLGQLLWPDKPRGIVNNVEVLTRGLDPILFEDKERLKRRSLKGVLALAPVYPKIVKAAWNLVFLQEGLFRYLLRKMAALFGDRPKASAKPKGVAKASVTAQQSSGAAGGAKSQGRRAAELNRLKTLAPALQNRAALSTDRERLASQWCVKLDQEVARKTRQTVDAEVARLAPKLPVDQLSEENAPKVALFLVEKSSTLAQVTESRAFHRYLYLTALASKSENLAK